MFNHSRRNLALWFTLSMGSILILFAGVTYYLRADDRLEATDRLLYKKATIMAASVRYDWVKGKPQVDLGNVPLLGNGLRPLGTEIVYVRWYDSEQQLKRFFGTPPTHPLTTSSDFQTIKTSKSSNTAEVRLRQVTLPIQAENELVGYLQVAIPLSDIQADLRQFRLALTLSLLVTLVLIGLIGWYLGGVAMQPIRQAYRQLQRFTADASHELRSPLSASLTNAQVARLLAADYPEIQPSLENIIDSTQSMNVLVNNLLLLARHQGRLAPELLKPIHLNYFLSELSSPYVAQAAAEDINFVVHIPEQTIAVLGDIDLLKQAVENLLSNAHKYTAPGGTVWLRLEARSSLAIIQVVDTGTGISKADLPCVFDRFYRADTQRTLDKSGFGLGLSLAQQIVQAHGGKIWANSVMHKGTTFQIELALHKYLHK